MVERYSISGLYWMLFVYFVLFLILFVNICKDTKKENYSLTKPGAYYVNQKEFDDYVLKIVRESKRSGSVKRLPNTKGSEK